MSEDVLEGFAQHGFPLVVSIHDTITIELHDSLIYQWLLSFFDFKFLFQAEQSTAGSGRKSKRCHFAGILNANFGFNRSEDWRSLE